MSSAVTLEPSKTARRPACKWCALRISDEVYQGTPACRACIDGGRRKRIAEWFAQVKRNVQPRVVIDE